MLEIILLAVIVFGGVGYLMIDLVNKDNQIAELQQALVEAYTEIEFQKLGVSK